MTVGELRRLLESYPDNVEVVVPLPIRTENGDPHSIRLTRVEWKHLVLAEGHPQNLFFAPGNPGPGAFVALDGEIKAHELPGGW